MRRAIRRKTVPGGQVSSTYQFNAPVKGWYVTANLAAMPKNSAYVLENWIPEADCIRMRSGCFGFKSLAVYEDAPIETLMTYSAGATELLFIGWGSFVVDENDDNFLVNQNSAQYSWTNFATSGGNFLYIVNGVDLPYVFDGSSWANPAITGIDESTFNFIFSYRARLFFLAVDSSKAYFLPADSIAGAIGTLEVGAELVLGGNLVAGGALTHDAAEGPNDYACFISSEGEVVVYTGTDPADPAEWQKVGTFRIGRPLGNRCVLKIGGDLAVLTQDGVVSLARSILIDRAAQNQAAFTANISPVITGQAELTEGIFGWQLLSWPTAHLAIVNVPVQLGVQYDQYIMNVLTGAWAKWTGLNAVCWGLKGDELFLGTYGANYYRFGFGSVDPGDEPINATAILAWNPIDAPGNMKHVKQAQAFVGTTGEVLIGANLSMDFMPNMTAEVTGAFDLTGLALWGTAIWGTDVWPTDTATRPTWVGISGIGQYLAPGIFATAGLVGDDVEFDVRFYSMNLLYEMGTIIG